MAPELTSGSIIHGSVSSQALSPRSGCYPCLPLLFWVFSALMSVQACCTKGNYTTEILIYITNP
jgi:hypothetical protein